MPENPTDTQLLDWLYNRANSRLAESATRRWTLMLDINSELPEFHGETPREALTKGYLAFHAHYEKFEVKNGGAS